MEAYFAKLFPHFSFDKLENIKTEDFYEFWQYALLQRCVRLFEWKGLPKSIPAHEIELRLLGGMCGIKRLNDLYFAVNATISKVYRYWDVATWFNWSMPTQSGSVRIDKNNFLIYANSLRMPLLSLIKRYAILLAHADMTLVMSFILEREFNGVPTALTQQDADNIKSYRKALLNGEILPIIDNSTIGVEWLRTESKSIDIKAHYDVVQSILRDFYSDIGVKTTRYKRANMTSEEVDGDESMLLFNINDMLKCREDGAMLLSEATQSNVSVQVAEPLMSYMLGGDTDALSNQNDI